MFLELSFDSEAGRKVASSSKAARSCRYDHDDKQELSLDELISDFRASASSLRQQPANALQSPLRTASPPKHSKTKERDNKRWGFRSNRSDRTKPNRSPPKDNSSGSDSDAVMPTPRLDRILKQRSSLAAKRRAPATRSQLKSPQRRRPAVRSPVLSSPSLTPPSLSPLTSVAISPLGEVYTPVTTEEDSIDALVGKDIRELNKLILTGSRNSERSGTKKISATRSPTRSDVLHQSTRSRKEASNRSSQRFKDEHLSNSRSSHFRLNVPERKTASAMLESPPPPPPPADDGDEEDSFAEELRKLRESRRLVLTPPKPAGKSSPKEEATTESSEVCAAAALKVRNASNAISDLLLEALKPFEDRQLLEEKEAESTEAEETGGDAALRNAATAELQSATQTIVSQLDLTFADMVERRKADLKAEADAEAAANEAEKKEKQATEEKKAAEDKEKRERDMEILRLIPMHGKLLTCSVDIEKVLEQLERTDTSAPIRQIQNATVIQVEIEALRSQMQRRAQEIESRLVAPSDTELSGQRNDISWRTVDWIRDNFELEDPSSPEGNENQHQKFVDSADEQDPSLNIEGPFGEIVQRQVVENLDLTILKLKHVLAIDAKEAAEAQEKQKQENEALEEQRERELLESERRQRESEDAEHAKQRVMGLTSIDEVEGWVEEDRQFQSKLGNEQALERVMTTLDHHMNSGHNDHPPRHSQAAFADPDEVLQHFDRLGEAMPASEKSKEEPLEHGDREWHGIRNDPSSSSFPPRRQPLGTQRWKNDQRLEPSSSSDSDGDDLSTSSAESDESLPSALFRRRPVRSSRRDRCQTYRSAVPSFSYQIPKQQTSITKTEHNGYSGSGMHHESVFQPSRSKQKGSKGKAARLQHEIDRTIQALQLERRQKASWVKHHLHYSHDLPISPTVYR